MEIDKNGIPISSASVARSALHYFSFLTRKNIDITKCDVYEYDPIKGNGEKALKTMYHKYIDLLSQYGSLKEIIEDVNVFKNFPQNNIVLGLEYNSPYNNDLEIFQGTDGVKYLCKQDIFLFIQNRLVAKEPRLKIPILRSMLIIFLKSQEKKLMSCCEFIPFNAEIFKDLDKELYNIVTNIGSLPHNCRPLSLRKYHFKDIFDQFERLLQTPLDDAEWGTLSTPIRALSEEPPTQKIQNDWKMFYEVSASLISGLKKVIKSYPLMFLPRISNKEKSTPPVRLFEDGPQKFVMRFELETALKAINPKVQMTLVFDKNRIECIELDDVSTICKGFGIKIEQISFVKTTIRRAKYNAVPILTPYKHHCILVVDLLFNFLRDLFFGYNLFNVPGNTFQLDHIIRKLNDFFDHSISHRFFVSLGVASYLYNAFNSNMFGKKMLSSCNVITNGFDLEDLVLQLHNSNFDCFFTDIVSYASFAFDEVMKNKKGDKLQTSDFIDAIEHCLRVCFFNRFPSMADFLHTQRGCHRVIGYECKKCQKESPLAKEEKVDAVYRLLEENRKKCEVEISRIETTMANTTENSSSKSEKKKKNKKKTATLPIVSSDEVVEKAVDTTENNAPSCATPTEAGDIANISEEKVTQNVNPLQDKTNKLNETTSKQMDTNAMSSNDMEKEITKKVSTVSIPDTTKIDAPITLSVQKTVDDENSKNKESLSNKIPQKKPDQKTEMKSDQPEKQSNSCDKCYRSSELCTKAQTELKAAQNKVKTLEKELEAKQSKKDKKKNEEIRVLTEKLEVVDQMNKMNERRILEKEDSLRNLTEKLKVAESLIKEKEVIIVSKSDIIAEYEETIFNLKKDVIKNKSSNSHLKLIAPSKNASSLSEEIREEFDSLMDVRNMLQTAEPTRQAKDSVNKLKLLTNRGSVKSLARRELRLFHENHQKYMEAINKNIELIQKNPNINKSQLNPMPEYPHLSETFYKEYEAAAKEKTGIADLECLICVQNMGMEDELHKCPHCTRSYHKTCTFKWCRIKNACPVCTKQLMC